MRRPLSSFRPEATSADKLVRLATYLANVRPDLVPMLTPEYLAGVTGVPAKRCEYELTIKRQKMAARG